MKFELPPLRYAKDALAPYISPTTVDVHHERHHRGYLDKLRSAIAGTRRAKATLEQLVCESEGEVFNLAAQVWNHTFYFDGMCRRGGGQPPPELTSAIERDLGSTARFHRSFAEAANEQFGSGWAWLALDRGGRLQIVTTSDADNPLRRGMAPLLTIDVWEHAYYLDYQSERSTYVEAFLDHLVDWQAVARRFAERQPVARNPAAERDEHAHGDAQAS